MYLHRYFALESWMRCLKMVTSLWAKHVMPWKSYWSCLKLGKSWGEANEWAQSFCKRVRVRTKNDYSEHEFILSPWKQRSLNEQSLLRCRF